jgi:hypothetical protein
MKFDRIISHSYDLMVMAMTWCVLVTTWAILTFGGFTFIYWTTNVNWEIWRTIFLLGSLYITYDVFNDWKGMFW